MFASSYATLYLSIFDYSLLFSSSFILCVTKGLNKWSMKLDILWDERFQINYETFHWLFYDENENSRIAELHIFTKAYRYRW